MRPTARRSGVLDATDSRAIGVIVTIRLFLRRSFPHPGQYLCSGGDAVGSVNILSWQTMNCLRRTGGTGARQLWRCLTPTSVEEPLLETDPTRMCELLVGLPEVRVLGVIDVVGAPVEVMVEQCVQRPRCSRCGSLASIKERPSVTFVDLPCFGRPARLVWRKHRWGCPVLSCPIGSWTDEDPRIAAPRMGLTDRAGRWATEQVGRHGRSGQPRSPTTWAVTGTP